MTEYRTEPGPSHLLLAAALTVALMALACVGVMAYVWSFTASTFGGVGGFLAPLACMVIAFAMGWLASHANT